ncbi:MAG TPA: hypothetical protein VD713_00145, partial [Sphingomonadales bacterium]|nr:hypothetical protein [Sphingomonadales bacterium]
MNKACLPLLLGFSLSLQAQTWPAGTAPRAAPERAELAPDQVNRELPVNHAKLVWFVSGREVVRTGQPELDKVMLGKMLDQDIATPTPLPKPR